MDEGIKKYFDKLKSPQKEICLSLRTIILNTYPGITEEMKWGVPVYDGGKFYIGAVRVGVNLGFSMLGLSENEMKRFEGKGRLMRHIKITNERDISEKGVIELLHVVKRS